MNTPEQLMKEGIESLNNARKCFNSAIVLYKDRNDEIKADSTNAVNVSDAVGFIYRAYDCISEIAENDI
jgi:cation transport regulator ChaB